MKNTPKRHHTVPQWYLRRFAVGDNVQLAKRTDLSVLPRPTDIVNATVEGHFYTIDTDEGRSTEVEEFFANTIEPMGKRAVERIVDAGYFPPAAGLREQLSTFCAFQFVRGPSTRAVLVEDYKTVAKKLASLMTPEIARKHLLDTREPDEPEPTDQDVDEFVKFARDTEGYTISVKGEANLHLSGTLKNALELVPFFMRRSWKLLEFSDDLLVTGDEPIALTGRSAEPGEEALGVGVAAEILVPTDPRHALALVRGDLTRNENRVRGTPAMAAVINRNVIYGCHRWIVFKPGTDPLRGIDVPAKGAVVRTIGKHVVMHARPPRAP